MPGQIDRIHDGSGQPPQPAWPDQMILTGTVNQQHRQTIHPVAMESVKNSFVVQLEVGHGRKKRDGFLIPSRS
jgi:hypothetical protein